MKKLFLLMTLVGLALAGRAQFVPDTVTIQEIQTVSQEALEACVDTPSFLNDTVFVRGVVTHDGNLSRVFGEGSRNVWIQDGSGPWSGINVFTTGVAPDPNIPVDILDLLAGDSVEIKGYILEFGNETELVPLEVNVVGQSELVEPTLVNVGDLNDQNRINQLPSGEQWEGVFVEIQDVTVSSVDFFSNNSRVSFNVVDEQGNTINISDRFLAQRLPINGGTFVAPSEGTRFNSIRGIIAHSANGCTGDGGRGYELFPFDESHYDQAEGVIPPQITGLTRNPIVPASTEDANISALIQDSDGSVTSATLFYAVGEGNNTYLEAPMTANGNTYTASIPNTAYSEGDFVKYYIAATDNDGLTANSPDVPGGFANPRFFTPRDNGQALIRDVQYTPYDNGTSGYQSEEVTVEGVVISSAQPDNLGIVYIQQEEASAWAGLLLTGNTALAGLEVGEKVRVRGTIADGGGSPAFGLTQMVNVSQVDSIGLGTITPLEVDPGVFSMADETNEQYEGMLIRLKNPNGPNVYVVEQNADAPSNFGEYRIGTDIFDPNSGTRILAGRNTGSAPGSLNFSYVNDSRWATESGVMNVDTVVVQYADSMEYIQGPMHYSFGNFKLLPRNNDDIVFLATNLADELAGSTFLVYPNPTAQTLNIRYEFPRALQAELVLFDLMGRQLSKQEIRQISGEAQIPVQQLANGTYLLALVADGNVIKRQKVVVAH